VVLTGAEGGQGTVIATSDDEAIARRTLDLDKYPEIREAVRTRKAVVVDRAELHPLLEPVKDAVSAAGMGAMAVLPLALEEEILGVLFLRAGAQERGRSFAPRELDLAAAVANATAVALERRRIEAELAKAQKELEAAARQAMIVELAGAAAHELNQPLTSVLGYAELLQRRLDAADAAGRYVGIILREAERMAEVVRKIGSITRHETRAYVGETRIVDLEKATAETASQALPRPMGMPSARSSS
jgi:signal transduction histidine kinase